MRTFLYRKLQPPPQLQQTTLCHQKSHLIYEKIFISTKSTKGLDSLKEHIKTSVGYNSTSENTFIARRRHLNALENSIICIKQSIEYIASYNDIELAAEEMRKCQNHLNEILGNFTADNLLSEIFNTFCIGK